MSAEQRRLFEEMLAEDEAAVTAASGSTKNRNGECDPERHQTKKVSQWSFGMMARIGVDADSGLVNAAIGAVANINDVTQAVALLHGEETDLFPDAGYPGVAKREEVKDLEVDWRIAMRPGKRRVLNPTRVAFRVRFRFHLGLPSLIPSNKTFSRVRIPALWLVSGAQPGGQRSAR